MTVDIFDEIKGSGRRCGSNVRFFAAELNRESLKRVARPERFELPTLWFEARCSIQLSYGRTRASVPVHLSRFKKCLLGWKLALGIGRGQRRLEFLLFFQERRIAGIKLQHFVNESKRRLVVS
jgi:hypothetical protein